MPVAYILGSNPIWNVFDLVGRPLGAGTLGTFFANNPTIQKPVYQDPNGTLAWTNPINFNENGQLSSPIYFANDTAYYLVVNDKDGNLVWSINNYSPPSGSGGGGTSEFIDLQNMVGNNVFYHFQNASGTPTASGITLAPGNHEGFSTPDTTYVTNGTTGSDSITFQQFALDSNPFAPGDVTPEYSLNYICSVPGNDSTKYIRLPINLHVNSLENIQVSFSIWAIGNSGTQQISANIRQFLGTGSVDADIVTPILGTTALTTGVWIKYTGTVTIPALPGGTSLSACGDDAVFLEIGLPDGVTCNLNIAKPVLVLGANVPLTTFQTYDQVDTIISSPRTGDGRFSLNSFVPFGWVAANDGTIGNASSNSTNRANQDTFQLYKILWSIGNANNTYAPIYTSGGTPTTFGANAAADFTALKQIRLTQTAGRAIVGAGVPTGISGASTWNLGQDSIGLQEEKLAATNLPIHSHTFTQTLGGGSGANGTGANTITSQGAAQTDGGTGLMGTPFSIMNPSSIYNIFIKL